MTAVQRGLMPPGWDADLSDEYEWVPLRLPPDLTRISASTRLSIEAEYRVMLFSVPTSSNSVGMFSRRRFIVNGSSAAAGRGADVVSINTFLEGKMLMFL